MGLKKETQIRVAETFGFSTKTVGGSDSLFVCEVGATEWRTWNSVFHSEKYLWRAWMDLVCKLGSDQAAYVVRHTLVVSPQYIDTVVGWPDQLLAAYANFFGKLRVSSV